MDEEIKYIDEKKDLPKKNANNNTEIELPTWSIEPPLEIERIDNEL